MSGTALYRALVAPGAPENSVAEAAGESDDVNKAIIELRTSARILIAINSGLVFLVLGLYFSGAGA